MKNNFIEYYNYTVGKLSGCIINFPFDFEKDQYFGLGLNYIRYKVYKNLKLGLSDVNFKTFINEIPS